MGTIPPHGQALVLVFVIVIFFGVWFSVGCGVLGLFLWCSSLSSLSTLWGFEWVSVTLQIYRGGSGVLTYPQRVFLHPFSTSKALLSMTKSLTSRLKGRRGVVVGMAQLKLTLVIGSNFEPKLVKLEHMNGGGVVTSPLKNGVVLFLFPNNGRRDSHRRRCDGDGGDEAIIHVN